MARSALIVASWMYEDPLLRRLVAPAQDAESLSAVLRNPDIGNFDVTVLANEPSYRVCEQVEAFFSDREHDDLLVLYFSGHGVTDSDGLLYYAASNTLHKRLRSTGVAASWVSYIMNQCRSRRQVLLLDCCYSGAFARTKAAASADVGKYFTGSTLDEGRGKFILTASDAFQYSFEGDAVDGVGIRSVFTQAVVEGLRSGAADIDGDGQITMDELYSFVYNQVRERRTEQSPRKWASDVEGAFVIASNPAPSLSPLPEDLQLAIDSDFSDIREKAVARLEKLLRGRHRGLALAAQNTLLMLVNDDSRRVSSAAERCLIAYREERTGPSTKRPPAAVDHAPPASVPEHSKQQHHARESAPIVTVHEGEVDSSGTYAARPERLSSVSGSPGVSEPPPKSSLKITSAEILAIAAFLIFLISMLVVAFVSSKPAS